MYKRTYHWKSCERVEEDQQGRQKKGCGESIL
jgi:hypothetical protein